ncbi:hypothetical protein [Bacillus xiapuensis]|uniref:Uncharacterized protein n=1 Tax=Bacillus xiapuensis TaxID=2014075 RepID=A0ABU6NA43_9BACI|nr:hypothetical protein [Bacillus xiapuensis]
MKPFKEKEKHKKHIGHYIGEQILEWIFEWILGLLWRLIVITFRFLGRSIGAIFHHFF